MSVVSPPICAGPTAGCHGTWDGRSGGGLVAREPCERDGRADVVLLASSGRAAHDEATPVYRASVQRHFAALLSPEQLAVLTGIAEAVVAQR